MLKEIYTEVQTASVITGSGHTYLFRFVQYQPVSQPKRHGADLPGRKSSDEALHLTPDASHQFSDCRTVDAAQIQLFLEYAVS